VSGSVVVEYSFSSAVVPVLQGLLAQSTELVSVAVAAVLPAGLCGCFVAVVACLQWWHN
jgi:fucose permease